jgi:hypothetical protein
MSYRNGDKSREHRIRKARQKKRETVRKLKGGEAKAQPTSKAQ